jgi:hypothetical protein
MKLSEILERLRQPVPPELISYKTIKDNRIKYISWTSLTDLLDQRAGLGGWSWKIKEIQQVGNRLTMIGCLTIYGDDRSLTMMATGDEDIDLEAYGTPATNTEAQCLRRCCSKYGLGRILWKKERKSNPQLPPTSAKASSLANGEITRQEWLDRFGQQQPQKV